MSNPDSVFEETSRLYHSVIEDVMRSVKPEFQAEGVDDVILHELEVLWRRKLDETGALTPAAPPVPEGEDEDIKPKLDGDQEAIPAGTGEGAEEKYADKLGRPEPYMPPPEGLEGGSARGEPAELAGMKRKRDDDEAGVSNSAPAAGTFTETLRDATEATTEEKPKPTTSKPSNLDNEELSSTDEEDDPDIEPQTSNLMLAQFEKVTRAKTKWKCTLKDGIVNLNGRDVAFHKANGEFEF